MVEEETCPRWQALARDASPAERARLRRDLARILSITVGRRLSLRERNRPAGRSAVTTRLDFLRNALSTDLLDLRDAWSLTEYYENGAVRAAALRPYLHAGDAVLEYGVGIGRLAMHLRPHCARLAGCDIEPVALFNHAILLTRR